MNDFLSGKKIITDLRQKYDHPLVQVYQDYDDFEEIVRDIEKIADASGLLESKQPTCDECLARIQEALESEQRVRGVSPEVQQNYWTRQTSEGVEHLVTYSCEDHGHIITYSEVDKND